MFSNSQRIFALLFSSSLAVPFPLRALETPLSDTAVREAYFLGQHHDEIYSDFLGRYGVAFPLPKTGPHVASISFLTPYALTAMYSNQRAGTYSAQQAQIDHDRRPEIVRVVVQIWFTASYGEYIVQPADRGSYSSSGFTLRPRDFWRDFRMRVTQKDQLVIPANASGEPLLQCPDYGDCDLCGATLTFEYSASVFTADTVTILVTPPEGDPVSVDFDPASLR